MKIIIAGYGYVGKAVSNALKEKHEIIIHDPQYTDYSLIDHRDADGIVLCVPTPTNENGSCDISAITDVLDNVPIKMPVLIKSTIVPSAVTEIKEKYCNHSICYSPEFLRARSANQDFLNQKYVIIGGKDPDCFWQGLLQSALPNCKVTFNCTEEEACLVKYATNSFLALKTSFFNQILDICENTGMDFDIVRHLLSHDSRIGSDHTMVPGPDGERGWGGHCFPKDITAFLRWLEIVNVDCTLVKSTDEYNRLVRKNY